MPRFLSDCGQKERRRGRPRQFDAATVVDQARRLFWSKGLSGTSLEEVTAATGLHRPSLVNAFGDKRGLYLAALDDYLATAEALLGPALARPRLADALEELFARGLDVFCDPGRAQGCFMIATAMAEGAQDPVVAERARDALARMRAALDARVRAAAGAGDLGALDPDTITDMAFALHLSLANQSRVGTPRAEMERQVAGLVALVRRAAHPRDAGGAPAA
jgi:TetR/AcrR family transcriptional regulator, copper-responsive repressor